MITGEIKSKVDKMWEYFWTGGLTNPVDVIEQLTYLIFMKRLDQEEQRKEKEQKLGSIFGNFDEKFIFGENHQDIRWSNLIQLGDPKQLYDKVRNEAFEFIKNLDEDKDSVFSQYMENAIFKVPTPAVLQNTMDTIEEIFNNPQMVEDKDTKGDLYEYLLSKLSTSGKNGQFRTPKHIINMMVDLMKPTVEDKIIDPACGTSGFLVSSIEYIKRNFKDILATSPEIYKYFSTAMIHGNDTDATMLGISAMNLLLHDMKTPKLKRIDSLSTDYSEESDYTLILANPPFKGSVDEALLSNTLTRVVKTKKTELLFIALFLRLLKIGGRAAVIVPDGVLFGASNAHKNLRKELIENNQLEAVISMPSGVFKPYAGVSTGILIFTKTGNGGSDNVWFYDMTADGYSLDDKRNPVEENDIPDIIERFSNLENEKDRKRTDKSLFTTMFGTPEYNEKGWNFISLKDISYSKGEYGSNKPAINYNGGYRYIRITDINANGELKTEKVGVSDEKIEAQKYRLKENDILFARSGATVGKNFLYNKKYGKCIFAGYLIRFKLNPHLVSTKYLKIYLDTNYYWNWVKNCQNIVAQPNINAKQYGEDLKIMLPPIELQNKFAERIEKIEKLSFNLY